MQFVPEMSVPFLVVERIPYEEPYNTQLRFTAGNGAFIGGTDFYCGVQIIAEIGQGLVQFPARIGDEYKFEYGRVEPKMYRHVLLRAYTTDRTGSCALQIDLNNNQKEPDEGSCRFSIRAEAAALNRLGNLFLQFSKLEHRELWWTLVDGALIK